MDTSTLTRPKLMFPDAEAALVTAEYTRADVILEYGSGGSTVLAGDMPGKQVFSVESDQNWAQMMRQWFADTPPQASVDVIWTDIGPTKQWGWPKTDKHWRRFADYPLLVWDLDEFRHPDVVLVDGRFRQGCVLATQMRITRPVVLLFDDYTTRKHYHEIEEFVGPPTLTGRMARFDLTPQPVDPTRLLQIMKLMTQA